MWKQKSGTSKRLLAGLLGLALAVCLLPSAALSVRAAEPSQAESSSEEISASESSTEETAASESSAEETAASESSAEETAASESSAEETAASESSIEETSAVLQTEEKVQKVRGGIPLTTAELNEGINIINTTDAEETVVLENMLYDVDEGKALAVTGSTTVSLVFKNCTFKLTGSTRDINKSGVGYPGETKTKLGIGENVTFENCSFIGTDGGTTSGSGNEACIEFFGKAVLKDGMITGTDWQGQFMGLYGNADVTFENSAIGTTGNTGGWSYAMYGASVLRLNDSSLTATGMKRAVEGGNVNAFYSGDLRTNYDAIFIKDSTVNFSDNYGGGFAVNCVNIYVENSKIIVCDNLGNACNSGMWHVTEGSLIQMNGNRGGHGWSHISDETVDSTIEILHNGYAGYYITADSSFTSCEVDIRCNGEKLLSYSAGDVWLNGHTLSLKDCSSHVWLGGVGRKGLVTADNCPDVMAYDLFENKTKGNTETVLTEVTLVGQDRHTLFLNPKLSFDYARGDTEGAAGNSNDDDLFEDVTKETAIGKDTAKLGTLTTAQLSHHKYDWDNGVITDSATELTYGVVRYTCTDVCAEYIQWTDQHPDSFNCDGTYVYAPLVGLAFDDNVADSSVSGMPENQVQIAYGAAGTKPEETPVRTGSSDSYKYEFTGWYTDKACTTEFDFSQVLTANWTVAYAGWKKTAAETEPEDWEVSKSKTAANLDANLESQVTLSLPSAQETLVSDVVFVLDKSTSATLEDQAIAMLAGLLEQSQQTGAAVQVGVVIFNKEANRVLELTELTEDSLGTIEAAIRTEIKSGTNLHAGLLAGKAMLDADTKVEADRKYMIVISDGITYMFNEEPTAVAWSFWADAERSFAGPDNWKSKHGTDEAPVDWADWLDEVGKQVEEYGSYYDYPYGGEQRNKTPLEASADYINSIDKALYLSYETYQAAIDEGYHCYAMLAENNDDFPWATDFMQYLTGYGQVDFSEIQNDILYLLDAGSRVIDEIGRTDDYNFNFINDISRLKLTVGGKALDVTKIDATTYGFGKDENLNAGYQFVLHYYNDSLTFEGQTYGECFVWDINVPVSNFEPVQLSYWVELVNPKSAAGIYGQYDADGSKAYKELYTNNCAVLYPVNSNGNAGEPQEFNKPTVSYEVKAKQPDPTPTPTPLPTPGAETGDTAPVGLLIALAIAAAAVLGGLFIGKKKKTSDR